LTNFWTLAIRHGMVWTGSGIKPAIAYDKTAFRESINYTGGYGGVMATNPFDVPRRRHRRIWPPRRDSGNASPASWDRGKRRTRPTLTSQRTSASNQRRRCSGVVL
jgi:hypothetical protein